MNFERGWLNVVILPTGNLFATGGMRWDTVSDPVNPSFVYNVTPEVLVGNSQWFLMNPHVGPRDYHSTALLLPDGRVLVASGEHRSVDYQIWSPPYLTLGLPRPGGGVPGGVTVFKPNGTILSQTAQNQMNYNVTDFQVTWSPALSPGVSVEKVVLMRPEALTHHDDGGQRYVELTSWPNDNGSARFFKSPSSPFQAPPGWWMLFLVTNQQVPSLAYWVHLQ